MQKFLLKLLQLFLLIAILTPIVVLVYSILPKTDQNIVMDPDEDEYEFQQRNPQ